MYRAPCDKKIQVFVQFPVRQPETIRDPSPAGDILCTDNKRQAFCHDMGKNVISFISPVSQYDRSGRGADISQHLDQGTGFIADHCLFDPYICVSFITKIIQRMEMELVGASFSIAGRFTAFFVRRVITDVQIRSVTSQELKSIISMSCRKFLCKMIKQVTHGIWKKLGPLLVDSGKRRDISRKPVLEKVMGCSRKRATLHG